MQDMFRDMMIAITLASLFVYMIMVALFESYVHPFTIMFSIPMALVGGLAALAMTGQTLNMFSMIGILLANGLVTKNAILLVDRTNEQRAKGLSVREANHHDHVDDGARPDAAGVGARRRLGNPPKHGHCRHRRVDQLDAVDAGFGAGGLCVHGRIAQTVPPEKD
jgi:hypothetical protein